MRTMFGEINGSASRLAATLLLVAAYMGVELIGGILANSLALLADAGHMLSDVGSLSLALLALWYARRPGPPSRTYGNRRVEILAALANGILLVVIAIYIVVEAIQRLQTPQNIEGAIMLGVAAGGLAVNLVGLRLLRGRHHESLNVRGAWLHVVTDTLGSAQALVAGAMIWAFQWNWADPVASLIIAGLVGWSAWSLLRDAVNVLLESAPGHIDVEEVRRAIHSVAGVAEVHDLHVWTITSGFDALSVHARIGERDRDAILGEIRAVLRRRFGIEHSTVQLEEDSRGAGASRHGSLP